MSNITSSAEFTHFIKERGGYISHSIFSFCEKPDLLDKLFYYAEHLGVTKYKEIDGKELQWFLHGYWYSTEQINRMMNIKAFG